MAEDDGLSELGRAAVEAARRGWRVFPIAPGTKDKPMVKWGTEASSDPGVVSAWWRSHPGANVGLACGASGLAVVDLDDKKGKRGSAEWAGLELEHGAAPDTLVSRTPSGGRHRIYAGEARTCQDLGGARGVDVRGSGGAGGYVLIPPSVYRPTAEQAAAGEVAGEYGWAEVRGVAPLPGWVRDAAGRRAETRRHEEASAVPLDTPFALSFAADFLRRDWAPAVEGSRGQERTFRAACALRERGVSLDTALRMTVDLYNPRCVPPWPVEELAKIFDNAWRYASVSAPGGDHPLADFPGEPPEPPDATPPGVAESARGVGWRDWVWVSKHLVFIERSTRELWSSKSFDTHFAEHIEKGTASGAAWRLRLPIQKFRSYVYRPGEPEACGGDYNVWRPSEIGPGPGSTALFDEHLRRLLPDDRERGMLLDWVAWVLQNPGDKPMFMPVIQGVQGSGKSWFGRMLREMVGHKNTKMLNTGNVASRFNSWAVGMRLAVIEELMSDDKRVLANALKPLITEETMMIELKGRDVFEAENHLALIAFTNYRDAVRLENTDRRYMIFSSPAGPLEPAEAGPLWAFLNGGGARAVLREMLNRKVEKEWGLGRAPKTSAHEDMRRESLPEVERHLLEELDLGNPPFDRPLVSMQDLVDSLPGRLGRERGMTRAVTAFLRDEAKARNLGMHRMPGGRDAKRVYLWSLRNHDEMAALSHAERARLFTESPHEGPVARDFDDGRDPLS